MKIILLFGAGAAAPNLGVATDVGPAGGLQYDANSGVAVVETAQTVLSASIVANNQGSTFTANANLNGRVTVGWVIQSGKVTGVRIVENTTGDNGLGECISRQVRSLRFAEDVSATIDGYTWIVSGA